MPRIKMSKDIPLMEQAKAANTEILTHDFEFYLRCLVAGGNADKKAFSVLDIILHELTRRHIPMQLSVSWGHPRPRARRNTNGEYFMPPPITMNPLSHTLSSGHRGNTIPRITPEMIQRFENATVVEEEQPGRVWTDASYILNDGGRGEEQHGQE